MLGKTSVEIALLAEGAAQFKGAAHRLKKELARLHELAEEGSPTYVAEWDRVERLRHDLLIQREAMGMVHHEDFLEVYALPPRKLSRVSPRPAPISERKTVAPPTMWEQVVRWLRFR